MQQKSIQNKRFVSLFLLILLTMQISAVTHANEHLLNTSETQCIVHFDAEQFSNLLTPKNLELIQKQQVVKPYIQNKGLISNRIIISYLSRAPPSI